jgi:hypothetical protein
LVIELMGTSEWSKSGHMPFHIWRLTAPCRRLTPLARADSLRAQTVIQKAD